MLERKEVKRIDHTLRRECLLKCVVGGKIVGRNDGEE